MCTEHQFYNSRRNYSFTIISSVTFRFLSGYWHLCSTSRTRHHKTKWPMLSVTANLQNQKKKGEQIGRRERERERLKGNHLEYFDGSQRVISRSLSLRFRFFLIKFWSSYRKRKMGEKIWSEKAATSTVSICLIKWCYIDGFQSN